MSEGSFEAPHGYQTGMSPDSDANAFNYFAFCFPIVYNSFLSLLQALYVEIYFVFQVE